MVAACHHPILFGAILTKTVAADAAQKKTRREQDLAKAIHSMIRVLDETRSVDFYCKAFGLDIADRMDFETFTLVYLRNAEADFELELTINKGRDKPYELGDGYGHIAFCVDDLDSEHARFTELEFKPRDIVEFKRDGVFARALFLRRGSRRLQNRGSAAARTLSLTPGMSAAQKARAAI